MIQMWYTTVLFSGGMTAVWTQNSPARECSWGRGIYDSNFRFFPPVILFPPTPCTLLSYVVVVKVHVCAFLYYQTGLDRPYSTQYSPAAMAWVFLRVAYADCGLNSGFLGSPDRGCAGWRYLNLRVIVYDRANFGDCTGHVYALT